MEGLLRLILLATVVVTLLFNNFDAAALNDYILDYQPLEFSPSHVHEKHSRVRRQIDPHLQLVFKAYNTTFDLILQPDQSVFADNHEFVLGNNTPQTMDTSFIYTGTIAGDSSSSAFISIIRGSVSGHIIVPGKTTYHIEPAKKHFDNPDFHTIIYPESHMNLNPFRHKQETCGSHEIYNLKNKWRPVEVINERSKLQTDRENINHNKYSAEMNIEGSLIRRKRDLKGNNRTCIMSLQADVLLYNHYLDKFGDKERAKEEILALFASHIKAINDIYVNTHFERADNPNVYFRGINFQLQRSKIMDDPKIVKSGFYTDNLDVSNFLDLTAEDDFTKYCLAHTFTYRDFVGGTLGLAWVATPESPNAGICAKYGPARDVNNVYSNRSLNTGIVTFINFKQDVPPRVSQLTFAHEVGHNFGSEHDKSAPCAPYGTGQPDASKGNYIMFPSATQGNLPNNAQFSSCSKDNIAKVLATLAPDGKRTNCFQDSNKPFCGNNIVESGENCDCGFGNDCKDGCCVSQNCSLISTAACSPTQGPCCSTQCKVSSPSVICMNATECAGSSQCSGVNATCLPPTNKKHHETFCSDSTKVCENGECTASVCAYISWEECFLTASETNDPEKMCYVSCRKNASTECISSYDQQKVTANPDFDRLLKEIRNRRPSSDNLSGVKRPAGSPCNDYKGYCDVFSKCRNVDAEGPFKQLTDLIFNPVTLKNIRSWIEDHWWAVLLMCVGVVIFMGVFVKIFEYNTPNKDPKKKYQPSPASRPQGASRPHHNKRSDMHNNDVPLHDRGGHAKNYGYHNHAFQGPSGRGQQDGGYPWQERY